MYKKTFLGLLLLLLSCNIFAKQVVEPTVKSKTCFAIIIDDTSYQKDKSAVDAYKAVVEADGLSTYLYVDKWNSPEEIKTILKEMWQNKKCPLEGAVFIGDIPIPMIRDAQYLSSAFKMNQKYNWKKSSIPSDRYYDDFGLKFKFIKQDADEPLFYYFSLTADSEQTLSPDIYTARIKPLELKGVDKYVLLADYLNKVVKERSENSKNVLDRLYDMKGHGYNSSDDLTWSGEQTALKEQLPNLFNPGNSVRFMNDETDFPMKNNILNFLQEKDLDVMLFHHHGAPDKEYINGYENGSSVGLSIENIKHYINSKVPSMAEDKGKEAAIDYFSKSLDVPRSWCEAALDPKVMKEDSLYCNSLDIYTTDIRKIKTCPRFVMFDACFNGSFHQKDNICGAYLFNPGKTIAVQGNTVNSVQDKWPLEMFGLLDAGMRVGMWNRYVCFLETHIMGDPTFHFANRTSYKGNINEDIVLHHGDTGYWKKMLHNDLPGLQCLALRELKKCNYPDFSTLLHHIYFSSHYGVVRLEALRLISTCDDSNTIDVLCAGMNDPYELVRRFAVKYATLNGSDKCIPSFVSANLDRIIEGRFVFNSTQSIGEFDLTKTKAEFDKQAAQRNYYDNKYVVAFDKTIKGKMKDLKTSMDNLSKDSIPIKEQRFTLTALRNHPMTSMIAPILKFISNPKSDATLKVTAVEVLGWYNRNYRKDEIIDGLKAIRNDQNGSMKADLKNEIEKTLARLGSK